MTKNSKLNEAPDDVEVATNVAITLLTETGEELSQAPIILPSNTTVAQLQILCNELLESRDDPLPIAFRTEDGVDIQESLVNSLSRNSLTGEGVIFVLLIRFDSDLIN